MTVHLSPHFSLAELCASETAERLGIDNTPPAPVVANLRRLANTLEQVRALVNAPLNVNSGFRCIRLNRVLKSGDNSAHVSGLAADFIAPRFGTPLEVCEEIHRSDIEFDQLIHEFGGWVHLGLKPDGMRPRRELLTIDRQGTRPGLLAART